MKFNINKQLMLVPLLLATGLANAAVSLSFNPQPQSGNTIDIGITISGLGPSTAPSLSTYDLDINFDPAYLTFANGAFGSQLDLSNLGGNPASAGLTSPGTLNVYELSFDSPGDLNSLQADSFTLATLTFNILNAGTSQLSMAINALGDAEGNALAANNAASVSVSTTVVPLPSAFFMMLPGLASLVMAGKRGRLPC